MNEQGLNLRLIIYNSEREVINKQTYKKMQTRKTNPKTTLLRADHSRIENGKRKLTKKKTN